MKKRTRKTYQSQVMTKIKRRKTSTHQQRNWLDLPEDIMSLIFMKLGAIEILLHAQHVCSSWRKLAKQPHLYCSMVILEEDWDYFKVYDHHFEKFVREAVDRSHGQLVKFSSDGYIKPELLQYVSSQSYLLKSLRLGGHAAYKSVVLLKDALIGLPFLDEFDVQLEMYYPRKRMIKLLGRHYCSKLICLVLNDREFMQLECDREAIAIAKYLPQLRRLHLSGCAVTNNGLRALLDGCTHLEYLNCGFCFNISRDDEDLVKRYAIRMQEFIKPSESDRFNVIIEDSCS